MKRAGVRIVFLFCLHKLAIFFLTLTLIAQAQGAGKFCTEGTGKAPVTLKSIIKKSFTAEIYSIDSDKKRALRGHEHYSYSSQISAVYLSPTQDSPYTQFHIYYRSDKFGVKNDADGGCEKTDDEPEFGLMSWAVSKPKQVTYVGEYESSGETLHNWRACFEDDNFEYQEDLYTSQTFKQWGTPQDGDYTPVKMIRKMRNKQDDQKTQINHYILRFDTRDDDDKDFKGDLNPPIGYTCPKSKPRDIPALPKSIIYTSEPTDSPQTPTEYIVDTEKQIIVAIGELGGTDVQYKELDSFKLGVNIQIPEANGESCKITAYAVMGDSELDTSLSYSDSYRTTPFETVSQFIGLSDGFTYNGRQTCRGIPCIAFSKYYDDYRGNGPTTVVLYFSANKMKDYSSVGRDDIEASVLLRKDVWQNDKVVYEHNIYNAGELDYSRLDYDVNDISACQGQMGEIEFTLLFESKDSGTKANFAQREALKNAMKAQLIETTGVNELRIHIMDMVLESGKLMARVRLLGPLTEESYILELPSVTLNKDDITGDKFIATNRYGQSYCPKFLDDTEGGTFATFCSETYTCSVYKEINPSYLKDKKDCVSYFLGKNKAKPVGLDDAWDKLTDAVDSENFEVSGYKASEVIKFDPSTVHNSTIPNLLKYRKVPGARIGAAVETTTHSSLVSCSDSCTASIGYQCEAFTFCDQDKLCVLNPALDKDSQSSIQPNEVCDVYLRKYVTEFTAMELTSAAIDKEMVFEQIDDADLCARLCLDLTDFRCESFDFCSLEEGSGSGTCSLFRKHFFDVAQSSDSVILPSTRCTHYSRNYLGDYDRKEGITELPIMTQIRKSSPESCAQSCSSQDTTIGESRCTMFQFCPIGGMCEFVDESSLPGDASRLLPKLKKSLNCATYSLKKNVFQIHGRSQAERVRALSAVRSELGIGRGSEGYGAGAMAGLAIAMLVLGAVVVMLGLFLWSRFKQPGDSGCFSKSGGKEMSMKFSKADFEKD